MTPELLVLVPDIHPRLTYIFQWMGSVLGFGAVHLTQKASESEAWTGVGLHYQSSPSKGGFWLPAGPTAWWMENNPGMPEVQVGEDMTLLYPLAADHPLPMDLPAAVFWLLSRVEEYGEVPRDDHGRFPASASLAAREGFLHRPVVDAWLIWLRSALLAHCPGLVLPDPKSRVVPTIDVDFAWRYLHKPLHRQWRTLLGDAWRNGPIAFLEGMGVITGFRSDPYDLYETFMAQEALLFFPLGDPAPFDLQHSWREGRYRDLVKAWADQGRAGLHPSYAAATDQDLLRVEVDRFVEITGCLPRHSRQHFLRMRLPQTYRSLLDAGIREDWTMGYADRPGFRAGTAHPFPWYDLLREEATPLLIHPLAIMDMTLHKYLGLLPDQAREQIANLWAEVQRSGGDLVTLWHHPSVACTDRVWYGWEGMYQLPE